MDEEEAVKTYFASIDSETRAAMLAKTNRAAKLMIEAFEKVKFAFAETATQIMEFSEPLRSYFEYAEHKERHRKHYQRMMKRGQTRRQAKGKQMTRKYITNAKTCYCHTCQKKYHWLGINRHRAMHRDKCEDCKITYTYGDTYTFHFSTSKKCGHLTSGGREQFQMQTVEGNYGKS